MKIVFWGTSELAASVLRRLLLSKHQVLAVVTAADKRKGRGMRLTVSAVKAVAQKEGLAVLQPEDLGDAGFIRSLKEHSAHLFVVCAYGKILTKEVLQIPAEYAINLHTSLLPEYRGAAPVNWAIIRGETRTGVTIFKMNEDMDAGEIILQRKTDVSSCATAVSLAEELSKVGKDALIEALDLIEQGRAILTVQDESRASLAPKLKKEDGLIDWSRSALDIHNRVRGLQPWPGAFTYFGNKLLKIWVSQVIEGTGRAARPGEVMQVNRRKGILVQAGRDKLLITDLQLEGKKRMFAGEFISGHRIEVGRKLGKLK